MKTGSSMKSSTLLSLCSLSRMQDVSYSKPLILSVKFLQPKSENEPRVKSWLSAPNTIRIEKNLSKF